MRLIHAAVALAAAAGLASAAPAARKWHSRLPEGTPVMLVGQVSSAPGNGEEKMQIALGPRGVDYTLHLRRATVLKGPNGDLINEDDFHNGQWVRAEGRIMSDSRRVMVSRIRLITTREPESLKGTPYYRPGYAFGYLTWPFGEARVAGSRYVYRRAE